MNETVEAIKDYIRHNDNARKEYGSDIYATYKREERLKGDYRGRQIFELLQNADDCGKGSKQGVRVKFRFANDGDRRLLAVANTGKPFSAEGVNSLFSSDDSPKDDGETIGNMGLGFRSVLNWTSDIKIVTGDFTISFSEDRAKAKLEKFKATANEKDKVQLCKIDRTAILSSCSEEDVTETDEETARRWLEGEYSTAILLYCDKESLEDKIQPELDDLHFEELLFLKHTTEIEIESSKGFRTIKCKKKDVPDCDCERVVISGNGDDSVWYVWRRTPSDDDVDEDGKKVKAEIVLCYSENSDVRENLRKSGHLYSYFATDVFMHLPYLVHADLSLMSNRRSLWVDNSQNRFVLDELADFMCETSLKISRAVYGKDRVDYTALSALIPSGQYDEGVLKEYGFFDRLYEGIEKTRLLPSINGEYLCLADNPRYFRSGQFAEYETEDGKKRRVHFSDVLDRDAFCLLLKRCDNPVAEGYLVNRAHVKRYDIEELCRLVNLNAKEYVDDKRYLDIIQLIYRVYGDNVPKVPHLMLDGGGELVEDGSSIFVGSEASLDIPGWAKIKILDPEMREELKGRFGSDGRALAERLSVYGCREYSVSVILGELIASSADDVERTRDLLQWLYGQWKQDRQSVSEEAIESISVITTENELARADECYLGDEYGYFAERRITQYIDGARYLASKEDLGLASEKDETVKKFAHFLGLTELPRFKTVDVPEEEIDEFIDYIGMRFGEKCSRLILRDGKTTRDYNSVKKWTDLSLRVSSVDNLDTILKDADFYDIANWLLKMSEDKALRCHLYEDFEADDESLICGYSSNGSTYREIPNNQIRSWFRYKLMTVAWLGFGERRYRYSFSECTIAQNDFYPMICPLSHINGETFAERTGGKTVDEAFRLFERLGMPSDICDLPGQTIYDLLYNLHNSEAKDDSVMELYGLLCRSYVSEPNPRHFPLYDRSSYEKARDKFFSSGQILAKVDEGYEYCKVSEVYYIDSMIPYSEDILKYPMLPLPRKSGNIKVHDMFGVMTGGAADVEVKLFELHRLNAEYKREFEKQKCYVLANRMKVAGTRDLNRILKMGVVLVESAAAEIKYTLKSESKVRKVDFRPYSFVIEGSMAYIEIPAETGSVDKLRSDPEFIYAITYVVSDILNIDYEESLCFIFMNAPETNEVYFKIRENESYLVSAKKEIGGMDPEDRFWKDVAEAKGCDAKEVIDSYESLLPSDFDYGNLGKIENIEPIKNLFKELGISASDFNTCAMFPVDFTRYNAAAFERLKNDKRDRYLCWIAVTMTMEDDKTISDYNEKRREYEQRKAEVDDPDFDPEAEFENAFGIAPDRLPVASGNFNEILSELDERQKSLEKREETGERDGAGDSAEDISGASERPAKAPKEPEYNAVMDKVDTKKTATFYDGIEWVPIVRARSGISLGGRRHGRTYDSETDVTRKENGFEAEYAVFKMLKEMEGNGQIKELDWVSGNAEYAGVKSKLLASDVAGYDISFVDSDDMKHYVDVKGSSSTGAIRFSLSKNEFKMGMKTIRMPGVAYDIYFVPLGNNLAGYRVRKFEKFFVYDTPSENFFDNKRYSVDYKSFDVTMTAGKATRGSDGYIIKLDSDEGDRQT